MTERQNAVQDEVAVNDEKSEFNDRKAKATFQVEGSVKDWNTESAVYMTGRQNAVQRARVMLMTGRHTAVQLRILLMQEGSMLCKASSLVNDGKAE